MQAFLSYSVKDVDLANQLANDLRAEGIKVWKAPESILPGERWVKSIERGLGESTHMLLVLSPAALESEWVDIEITTAIRLERQGKLTIIPLDYRQCEIPLLLGNYHFISFRTDYTSSFTKLLERLGVQKKPTNLVGNWRDPKQQIDVFFRQNRDRAVGLYDYGDTGKAVGVFIGTLNDRTFEFKWKWLQVDDDPYSMLLSDIFNGAGQVALDNDSQNAVGAYWAIDSEVAQVPLHMHFVSSDIPAWLSEDDFKRFEFYL